MMNIIITIIVIQILLFFCNSSKTNSFDKKHKLG